MQHLLCVWRQTEWCKAFTVTVWVPEFAPCLMAQIRLSVPLVWWHRSDWVCPLSDGTDQIECAPCLMAQLRLIMPLVWWHRSDWLFPLSDGTDQTDCVPCLIVEIRLIPWSCRCWEADSSSDNYRILRLCATRRSLPSLWGPATRSSSVPDASNPQHPVLFQIH
jgi:hypothetical protein